VYRIVDHVSVPPINPLTLQGILAKLRHLSQLQNVQFWAISVSDSKYNPQNITYIPVVIFFAFLDFASNLKVLKLPHLK
jgi:hypothetical protein